MSRRAARIGRLASLWAVSLALVVLVTATTAGADPTEALDAEDLQRGAQLYAQNCVACHGPRGEGGPGPGLLAGPPIEDIEVAFADLVIRTGRMPIVAREAGIVGDPDLDDRDRAQLVAWMTDSFGLEGEVPDVPEGDPGRGRLLFNEHCAACHSTTGWGGVAGGSVIVLPVRDLDRVAIFSAARVGPMEMPSFGEGVLSDEDLADIATAVERLDEERPGPPLLANTLSHVTGTLYAAAVIAVLVGLTALVARLPVIATAKKEEFEPEDGREES